MLDKTGLKTFIYTYGQTVQPGGISAPTELSNLELWLKWDTSTMWQDTGKTTAVTTGSDPVRVWEDQSGGAHDAIASNDDRRPLYQTDGITFDGTDDRLEGTITSFTGTDITYFVVFELVTFVTAGDGLFSIVDTNIGVGSDSATPNLIAFNFLNATTLQTYFGAQMGLHTIAAGTPYYASATFDGANSTNWLDGSNAQTVAATATMELDDYILGARIIGGNPLTFTNAKIKEVILYTEAKSQADIDSIEAYLASTHGI